MRERLRARFAPLSAALRAWGLIAACLLGSACSTFKPKGDSLLPVKFTESIGAFRIHTNAPLGKNAAPFSELRSLEDEVRTAFNLPVASGAEPIDVYLLKDEADFAFYLKYHHPDLPRRRAFFIAEGDTRAIYTYQGEKLEEDLRHEATHAILHASVRDLPLWLDEGIAEYFESPGGRGQRDAGHDQAFRREIASGWKPDLRKLIAVTDLSRLTRRDYCEAWSWARLFLDDEATRKQFLSYLTEYASTDKPEARAAALEKFLGETSAERRMLVSVLGMQSVGKGSRTGAFAQALGAK